MLTIVNSITTMIGGDLYDHLMSKRIFILIMNEIFISALKIMRQMVTGVIWIC
jgi:hypothetical protein